MNKAVYLALGVRRDGTKEVPGLWIGEHEGAKFWLSVVTKLKNRGVEDIFGYPADIRKVIYTTNTIRSYQ